MGACTVANSKVWVPFNPSDLFRRQIDDICAPSRSRPIGRERLPAIPSIEVTHKGREYLIRIDAPGSDLEEADISFVGNSLVIKDSRQGHWSTEVGQVLHCEVAHGDFERIIELPMPIRLREIRAVYKRGVLELIIVAEAKPARRIPVQTSTPAKSSSSTK